MNERSNRGVIVFAILLLTLACTLPLAASTATPTPGLSAQDIAATAVGQTLTALAPASIPLASPTSSEAAQPTLTVPPPAQDTATPCLPHVTANTNVNVRFGPGQAYDILGNIPAGGSALVFGQNDGRSWWYIEFPSGSGQYAWVAMSVTSADCIPQTLQIVAAPPLPTPTFTPTIVARPDLYVSDYMWSPLEPHMGVEFHVRVSVYNQGNAAAGSFTVQWWLSVHAPAPACTWNLPSLAAHGGRVLECGYTPGGWSNYPSQAIVDSANTVIESDEGNNTASATIQVKP